MVHDRFSKNYDNLRELARNAPVKPGVYILRNKENRIIYVGKAKILRNRLNSYFSGKKDIKTAVLLSNAASVETIIVSNEYEALLLENTLIKQHSPKYNITLKDGKTYPVVRITAGDFPRVFRTRHIVQDGSQYFGPFANIQALNLTLNLIEKIFPLRKCRTLKKRENPCLYFHLKRCLSPCSREARGYQIHVERVRKLLAGETSALLSELNSKMGEAAKFLKFEEAAELRNTIRAVENLSENNSVVDIGTENRDYIAWAAEGIFSAFSVFTVQGGRLTGQEIFCSRSASEEHESLESFIIAYYDPSRPPPPRIYLGTGSKPSGEDASFEQLRRYFSEQFGYSPELIVPAENEKTRKHIAALAMARQNAREELRKRLRERGAGAALNELKQLLGLKARPVRIEGFDISHLDGKYPVASLVSFRNGIPDKKNYRFFRLKTVDGIVNDIAAMREALKRRYSRLLREGGDLPDLVFVDGGIAQVNAAQSVLDELKINCSAAGLAKRNEEIWLPNAKAAIKLPERSEALKVLQFIRDEAHRFANSFNQRLRSKDLSFSLLEGLSGIGPKRAAAIMKTYSSLENVAKAEPEDIAKKCGITITAAAAVKDAARKSKTPPRQRPPSAAAALAAEAFAAEETPGYE